MSIQALKMRVEGWRLVWRLRRGAGRMQAFYSLVLAIGAYDRARNGTGRHYSHEMNIRVEHGFAPFEGQS